MIFPDKCKECKYNKKCRKKNITRGSNKCRENLGKVSKKEGMSSEKFSNALLWYYYNQSKKT